MKVKEKISIQSLKDKKINFFNYLDKSLLVFLNSDIFDREKFNFIIEAINGLITIVNKEIDYKGKDKVLEEQLFNLRSLLLFMKKYKEEPSLTYKSKIIIVLKNLKDLIKL